MLDKIDDLNEEIRKRIVLRRSDIRKDIKSLGIRATVSANDFKIAIHFACQEDLNLYKITGRFQESGHILYLIGL